jgi:hypothetical protein
MKRGSWFGYSGKMIVLVLQHRWWHGSKQPQVGLFWKAWTIFGVPGFWNYAVELAAVEKCYKLALSVNKRRLFLANDLERYVLDKQSVLAKAK